MAFFQKTIFLFFVGSFALVGVAHATVVENNVSIKASTGGNSTSGTTTQGSGETSVFIETIVDGETVQHVEEHKESEGGEPVEIEKHLEYISDSVNVQTQVTAEANGEIIEKEKGSALQIHEQQPPLSETTASQEVEENQNNNGSKSLISFVVEFFQNLFSRFFA